MSNVPAPTISELQDDTPKGASGEWQLKKLSPLHKTVMSLMAQGLKRQEISALCDITPEYVSFLARQPLCREYLRDMSAFADAQLEAMTEQSVSAIQDVLQNGKDEDRLKAARIQLEVTQRIGSGRKSEQSNGEGRLEALADRLIGLLHNQRQQCITIDGEATIISSSESSTS